MFIERLITLIGGEVSPNINYRTVQPKCTSLAKILQEKHQVDLSKMALPLLFMSIIILIPSAFYNLYNTTYGRYTAIRAGLLVLNNAIWYCFRARMQLFSKYAYLFIYACFAGFVFYFPFLVQDLQNSKAIFSAIEININIIVFFALSLLFNSSFSWYLFTYVPIYFISNSFLAYMLLVEFDVTDHLSICAIIFFYILMFGLLVTILVYRWLMLYLERDLLKIEESSQVDQLKMVLNKQTDGIALIEQTNVVLLSNSMGSTAVQSLAADQSQDALVSSTRQKLSERAQAYQVDNQNSFVQYLNLKLCNDALQELIQCELGEVDFSQLKRSSLKKAGPDLCFQPLFKLVALDDEDYDGINDDSSCSHNESERDINKKVQKKGVRFASLVDDNEMVLGPGRTNFQQQNEERPLASGLIFLPSLSKKGLIAVKNPFVTSDDESTVRKASVNALNNFLRSNKHKRISLVDIIFLICQDSDSNRSLTFEMDQLIQFQSQLSARNLSKKTVYEVSCQQVKFTGGQRTYNVVSFKDISTKEKLYIQNERARIMKQHQAAISQYMVVPINGIICFSETLIDKSKALDEQSRKIQSDLRKMSRMINNCGKLLMCHTQDLLDNKLLEGGTIVPMICVADLRQHIEDCVHLHKMQAEQVGIKIETKLSALRNIKVRFDVQRSQQVLTNLVSNAIKHSPADTTITVTGQVQFTPHGDGRITICVTDEGIGISKHDQKRIFEPYYKQKMQRRMNHSLPSGLGLGLSICQRICHALGGEIKVKSSRAKKGVSFEFHISCQKDQYIDESDAFSIGMSSRSSTMSAQAFLMRREKLKVRVGKTYQEDHSSYMMDDLQHQKLLDQADPDDQTPKNIGKKKNLQFSQLLKSNDSMDKLSFSQHGGGGSIRFKTENNQFEEKSNPPPDIEINDLSESNKFTLHQKSDKEIRQNSKEIQGLKEVARISNSSIQGVLFPKLKTADDSQDLSSEGSEPNKFLDQEILEVNNQKEAQVKLFHKANRMITSKTEKQNVQNAKVVGIQNIIRFSTNRMPFTDEEMFHMNSQGGIVVYVDDNYINQEAMRLQFREFNIENKLIVHPNRVSLVNFFYELLENLVKAMSLKQFPAGHVIQPIQLLIIDYDMVGPSCEDCLQEIENIYQKAQLQIQKAWVSPEEPIQRVETCIYKPFQAILTQTVTEDEDQNELVERFGIDEFLVKPISRAQVENILQKYNIIFENSSFGLVTGNSKQMQQIVEEIGQRDLKQQEENVRIMFEQEQLQKELQNQQEAAERQQSGDNPNKSKTKTAIEEIKQQFTEYEKRDIPFQNKKTHGPEIQHEKDSARRKTKQESLKLDRGLTQEISEALYGKSSGNNSGINSRT